MWQTWSIVTSQHAWSLGGTTMSKRSRNKNWSAMYGHMAPMAYLTSGWLWLRTISPGSSNGSVTRCWEPRWQRHTLTRKLTRRGFLILSIKTGHRAFRDHPGRLHYSGAVLSFCVLPQLEGMSVKTNLHRSPCWVFYQWTINCGSMIG
jgi:hypothetical protein